MAYDEKAKIYEGRALDLEERGDFATANRFWEAAFRLRQKGGSR